MSCMVHALCPCSSLLQFTDDMGRVRTYASWRHRSYSDFDSVELYNSDFYTESRCCYQWSHEKRQWPSLEQPLQMHLWRVHPRRVRSQETSTEISGKKKPKHDRRSFVWDFVQRLIIECFPCVKWASGDWEFVCDELGVAVSRGART